MAKNNKAAVAEANRVYFRALANTRASMGNLSGLAILTVVLLAVVNLGPLNVPSGFRGYEILSYVAVADFVVICISVTVAVLAVIKSLLYRFQVFFSAVMGVMAACLVYSICLLALPFVTLLQARGEALHATAFAIGGLITLALLAASTSVHVWLLRRRLRVGHSEKRTIGNYVAVSGSNRSKMFWIIFGVVAVVPNLLTGGQYLGNFLFAMMLIFFACVTPSLPVEFGYLAYLKSKDRDYWERRPRPLPRRERLLLARKVVIWVLGIAAALALFWVLAKYVL